MTPIRWAALAAALVAMFVVSVAGGAMLRRAVDAGTTAPPASLATPSPTPTHTPTPTSAPTPAPTPTQPPTAAPTPTPTPIPATPAPTALDPPTVEEFAEDLSAAIRDSDEDYLNARLHPEVITRFGADQCAAYIATDIAGDDVTWEIHSSSGPQEWDYASDDLSTVIPDAWFVQVTQPGADPEERELHFAPFDGTWRWFTDCGEPL